MESQTSTKLWKIEHKFHVLNLRNLTDEIIHQDEIDILLGTKGFKTDKSIKIKDYIIEPFTNVTFIKKKKQ